MQLSKLLMSVEPTKWEFKEMLILGWYDGPLRGFCTLTMPACSFYFKILAIRFGTDDLDDRLYEISDVQADLVANVTALHDEIHQTKLSWSPLDPVLKDKIDHMDAVIQNGLIADNLIIQTPNMREFKSCWYLAGKFF